MMRSLVCSALAVSAALVALSFGTDVPATRYAIPAVKDLPVIKEMPDPLTLLDGKKVTTPEDWKRRRLEMIKILEDYEYGHMPPPPGNVKGREVSSKTTANGKATYRLVHLTFGPDDKLGFDLGIFTPILPPGKPAQPLPAIVSLGFSSNETSVGQFNEAINRGYAVVTIAYAQLGADNTNYRKTAFFPAYPDYDWNDFSAWAWGISRAVDYLVTDPSIDKEKIAATGVSRNGQAVLLAGAFDERIALVAPVGGGSALRFSGKDRGGGQGIDEVVDQQTYWFGPKLPEFKGETDRLPCDQHWLLALAAPRAFILCNALSDQYGKPNASLQTYLSAKPVYAFLGAPENLGINYRAGQHGMTAVDTAAILDFADEKLRKMPAKRKFDQIPTPDQLKG